MKNAFAKISLSVIIFLLVCSSCSEDESSAPGVSIDSYVVLTAAQKWGSGFLTSFMEEPTGTVNSISEKTLQIPNSFGFRSYKNSFFLRSSTDNETGLQKYSVGLDGSIQDEGFIVGSTQYVIANDTKGYYLDPERGLLKIQIFNPTTMKRTGEIDLAELKDEEVEYQVVGMHTMAVKEGKLYAGMTYSTLDAEGYGGDQIDHIEFVVIDVDTDTYDKTIKYEQGGINSIGWGSSGNKMWTMGDDGALYFYSTGLTNGFEKASVIRIKKGQTEFDQEWRLDLHDYVANSVVCTGAVKDGKIYVELPSEPLEADFSNLQDIIFDYYVIDLKTEGFTKITGMPQHHFSYANEQAIMVLNDDVYFWVKNPDDEIDAYYKLNKDGESATQVFNLDHSGFMWGIVALHD